jgi:hypothetical protein
MRLKTVMDKITLVGQKGFSSTKYCQEVLIGLVDSINSVRYNRSNGALLSLDIKKAFDSTSHSYLQQVYEFFNFGPKFIRWLNLIGTNRKACIILGNGMYSEFFYLERGNAQGDTTSPYIFNLGFQILLLKLTFDLQTEGLLNFPVIPDPTPPLPPTVGTYNRKVSAYADDASLIVKMRYETLLRIKTILEDFEIMSGLVCNVDKTVLVPIGVEVEIDDRIRELGFIISNKVTILGLEIDRNGYTNDNFARKVEKIRMQIRTWLPFNLSLPGRIAIAKSMLYSQINYFGCFLLIPSAVVTECDNLITSFVKGTLNIAKKRLYKHPTLGGLGLFELKDFLDSQKCAWIKRSLNLNEVWKILIYTANYGRIFNCKARNINKFEYPLIHEIVASYERVSNMFTTQNENFLNCYIFENEKITINVESKVMINRSLFGENFFTTNSYILYGLRYRDFYDNMGNQIQTNTVRANLGINITELQIYHIRNACFTARLRYKKKELSEQYSLDIETFLMRRKKGSSHIHKILSPSIYIDNPHNINKFANNLDIVISGEQSKYLNRLWTNNIFSNQDKTFIFKYHNNTLGYNNVVAHFVRGHSPFCTLCTVANNNEQSVETPLHLFFDCQYVSSIVENLFKRITGDLGFLFSRREFFTTFERRNFGFGKNSVLTIVSKLCMKYIWDCRNRSCLPQEDHCWETITNKISYLIENNGKFVSLWRSSDLSLQHPPL